MQLSDFFSFKDLVRTALIASALFLLVGSLYGIFLHALFSSQVNEVKQDLVAINTLMTEKTRQAYNDGRGGLARDYRNTAESAKEFSAIIKGPPVTPGAYTYMNYWIASAAFTRLDLDYAALGMENETVEVLTQLSTDEVLGKVGWWGHEEFYGYSVAEAGMKQYLEKPPEIESHFWTFYIFVFFIAFFTTIIGVKEKYELPVVPELIYGAFMPVLFFVVYTTTSLLSLTRIISFLHPSQVNIMVALIVFVIMSIICAFGAFLGSLIRMKTSNSEV